MWMWTAKITNKTRRNICIEWTRLAKIFHLNTSEVEWRRLWHPSEYSSLPKNAFPYLYFIKWMVIDGILYIILCRSVAHDNNIFFCSISNVRVQGMHFSCTWVSHMVLFYLKTMQLCSKIFCYRVGERRRSVTCAISGGTNLAVHLWMNTFH